ncbi:hypothetical protein NQZ68_016370 [Dissostichus eleginoides]|nr:hypothetical protein NQZ68_016370 [Dissostichus eleginoides]
MSGVQSVSKDPLEEKKESDGPSAVDTARLCFRDSWMFLSLQSGNDNALRQILGEVDVKTRQSRDRERERRGCRGLGDGVCKRDEDLITAQQLCNSPP